MPLSSTTVRIALAASVLLNIAQFLMKRKEDPRWRAIHRFKFVVDEAVAVSGDGANCGFTLAINGSTMQLRRQLWAATAQLSEQEMDLAPARWVEAREAEVAEETAAVAS